jgi:hypothetical protein
MMTCSTPTEKSSYNGQEMWSNVDEVFRRELRMHLRQQGVFIPRRQPVAEQMALLAKLPDTPEWDQEEMWSMSFSSGTRYIEEQKALRKRYPKGLPKSKGKKRQSEPELDENPQCSEKDDDSDPGSNKDIDQDIDKDKKQKKEETKTEDEKDEEEETHSAEVDRATEAQAYRSMVEGLRSDKALRDKPLIACESIPACSPTVANLCNTTATVEATYRPGTIRALLPVSAFAHSVPGHIRRFYHLDYGG